MNLRPKLANFKDPDEWADALLKWNREQITESNRKEAEEAERREVFDAYQARKAEAREKHEDWDDVMAEIEADQVTIPVAASNAIIESEHGPEIAYYLAKNQEVRDKLAEMSITSAVREIGRIEARLFPEVSKSPALSPLNSLIHG